MSLRRRPRGAAAALLIPAALLFALVAPTGATGEPATPEAPGAISAPMPDYPTWQDVQNAKRNQAATQAEIERIEGILVALENEAEALGKVALIKDEEYAIASDALAAATHKVARLTDRAAQAQERADESQKRAAQLIAQLARTGGGDLTLGLIIGSASDTDQLLARLGSMNRLTESSADILARAQFDKNLAESLNQDAKAAEKIRKRLATEAEDALKIAQDAADKAAAEVAAQQVHIDQMYAQLASLTNTTAAVEQSYQEGLSEQQEAQQNNPPSPPANPPEGVDPTPDPPVGSAVQQAIAYAQAQLGEPYALGGAGPGSWDCSGLTKMSYASAGVYIGTHSASNQYSTMSAQGRLVSVSSMTAGDLLFYSNGGSTSASKYHVTIYIGGGQMIEAPRPGVNVRIVAVRWGDLVPYAGRPTG
ncbi:MAG: NlpC/P60 family protein [Rhodoglobus sp.]